MQSLQFLTGKGRHAALAAQMLGCLASELCKEPTLLGLSQHALIVDTAAVARRLLVFASQDFQIVVLNCDR